MRMRVYIAKSHGEEGSEKEGGSERAREREAKGRR